MKQKCVLSYAYNMPRSVQAYMVIVSYSNPCRALAFLDEALGVSGGSCSCVSRNTTNSRSLYPEIYSTRRSLLLPHVRAFSLLSVRSDLTFGTLARSAGFPRQPHLYHRPSFSSICRTCSAVELRVCFNPSLFTADAADPPPSRDQSRMHCSRGGKLFATVTMHDQCHQRRVRFCGRNDHRARPRRQDKQRHGEGRHRRHFSLRCLVHADRHEARVFCRVYLTAVGLEGQDIFLSQVDSGFPLSQEFA